jgi:EAL and modified HD-GYP domain-containing signal transduction protein
MAVMRTLAAIQDPGADFRSLARMIAQDALLSTKLLTMVNSPTFGLPRAIDSLEQAVAYAGLNALRSWMSLLTLASIPGKPPELTQLAILRAKMNETIATSLGLRPFDQHFSVGLFSVLDALLDLPIAQAIQNIPLAKETVDALVARQGAAGQVLQATLLWERGDWDLLLQSTLSPHSLLTAYVAAVQAALDFSQSLKP